ncbi:MAG: site-specific integrase [Pseudomonadota bacterium]
MMTLPKVKYTKQRGGYYHLNIPIAAPIRREYGGKVAFERSTGSSDPKEAERQVTAQRAVFDIQLRAAQRKVDQARLKTLLDPADAATVETLGGPQNLPKAVDGLREQVAFLIAGYGAMGFPDDEDLPPDAMRDIQIKAEMAAQQAFQDTITSELRRLKGTAAMLGEAVPPAPTFLDEGVTGIRELAEKMADDKQYTKQHRDSLRYTVRRWVELHGDLPIAKWEKSHLHDFAEALKGLPITREKSVQDLPIRKAIEVAKAKNLETMGDKIRQTRIDHMRWLISFALNQLGTIKADPFGKHPIYKQKVKHSDQAEDDTKPFSPAQIRLILPHCAAKFHEDTLDRWAPIFSAYTGARREEIGQLYLTDVVNRGNGLVVKITDAGEDQKVKNKHSFRTIPLPQPLIDAGFGDFVSRRRLQGGKMLFLENYTDNRTKIKTPREVQLNDRGRFTETYGERFSRYVRKPLKLVDDGLVFHSFRHSWTDAARRAKIDPEIRRLIAGRLDGEDATESNYGGADLLQEKLEAMEAVIPFLTLD